MSKVTDKKTAIRALASSLAEINKPDFNPDKVVDGFEKSGMPVGDTLHIKVYQQRVKDFCRFSKWADLKSFWCASSAKAFSSGAAQVMVLNEGLIESELQKLGQRLLTATGSNAKDVLSKMASLCQAAANEVVDVAAEDDLRQLDIAVGAVGGQAPDSTTTEAQLMALTAIKEKAGSDDYKGVLAGIVNMKKAVTVMDKVLTSAIQASREQFRKQAVLERLATNLDLIKNTSVDCSEQVKISFPAHFGEMVDAALSEDIRLSNVKAMMDNVTKTVAQLMTEVVSTATDFTVAHLSDQQPDQCHESAQLHGRLANACSRVRHLSVGGAISQEQLAQLTSKNASVETGVAYAASMAESAVNCLALCHQLSSIATNVGSEDHKSKINVIVGQYSAAEQHLQKLKKSDSLVSEFGPKLGELDQAYAKFKLKYSIASVAHPLFLEKMSYLKDLGRVQTLI